MLYYSPINFGRTPIIFSLAQWRAAVIRHTQRRRPSEWTALLHPAVLSACIVVDSGGYLYSLCTYVYTEVAVKDRGMFSVLQRWRSPEYAYQRCRKTRTAALWQHQTTIFNVRSASNQRQLSRRQDTSKQRQDSNNIALFIGSWRRNLVMWQE